MEALPLKEGHDPSRPAVTTAQAAERLGVSRFHVAEMVKAGALDGYGIPAKERTRWYVYVDALGSYPDSAGRTGTSSSASTIGSLRAIRDSLRVVHQERLEARNLLLAAYDAASYADSDAACASTLNEVMRSINDSERRNHKADSELAGVRAHLDELLDRLQEGG